MTTMHYWPVGGPAIACNADSGFRTSDKSKVNCAPCRATFASGSIADRRQRARETFFDAPSLDMRQGFEDAIEVATQVKITDDIIEAGEKAAEYWDGFDHRAVIEAALRAAGFEVVE